MLDTEEAPLHLRRHAFELAPGLAVLRVRRPVVRFPLPTGAKAWLVTGYEQVREVLSDAGRFGSDGRYLTDPAGRATSRPNQETITPHGDFTTYDPPDHTRLRRMVASAFTAKRVRNMEPRVRAIVAEVLDAMERSGAPTDLVAAFALPVPSMVICELLGIPHTDRLEFHERAMIRFDTTLGPDERTAAVATSRDYMAQFVRHNRAEPGDGLLGVLVEEHGHEIGDTELIGVADLLLLGGFETTANMLALGTLLLSRNPGHVAMTQDESRLPGLIEELLRYLSIVQTGVPRVARCDTTLDGVSIRRGERLLCSLPAANHDEIVTEDADRFDPARSMARPHIVFGHGIHHCIGAQLARLELRVALPELFRRMPALKIDCTLDEVSFRSASAIYGVHDLPVVW